MLVLFYIYKYVASWIDMDNDISGPQQAETGGALSADTPWPPQVALWTLTTLGTSPVHARPV